MLAINLARLIDQKLTTVEEISELAGVSPSTVYRWIAGQSQPDFDAIRLLVRHLKNPEAQRALLTVFTAGTAWQMRYRNENLDVNGDGKVDANDALDSAISMVRSAGDSLARIRETCQHIPMGPRQAATALEILEEVVHQCCVTEQVLV